MAKENPDESVLNMGIPKTLHQQAKKRAKSRGVSLAGYVRQLIIDDLEKANIDQGAG